MATHTIDRIVDANGDEFVFSDSSKAGTASPLMDGKASVGNSLKYAREDHVHPSDTSREDIANKTTVVLGTSDSKYPTDKAVAEFVNSSIATNTANYISNNGEPFTSVEQLEAYSGPVTNNDYAFVTGIDSEGNTYYDRYKATVIGSTVTWALEYRLNNSSFTAAQWSAINSGITSVLVAKIHDHSNKGVLDGITSDKVNSWDGKQDALTFDTTPTAGSTNPVTSDGINSALDSKANAANFVAARGAKGFMLKFPRGLNLYDGVFINILNAYGGKAYRNITFAIRKAGAGAPQVDRYNTDVSANTFPGGKYFSVYYGTYPSDPNTEIILIVPSYNISGLVNLSWGDSRATWKILYNTPNTTDLSSITPIEHNNVFGANKGSASVPVYVDANGKATPCTDDFVHDGDVTSTYSSTGTAPVNGTAVAAAIGGLDAKGIVINEIDGENVICFE